LKWFFRPIEPVWRSPNDPFPTDLASADPRSLVPFVEPCKPSATWELSCDEKGFDPSSNLFGTGTSFGRRQGTRCRTGQDALMSAALIRTGGQLGHRRPYGHDGCHYGRPGDQSPGDWLPKGVGLIEQRSGSFGDRLAGAIDDAYRALPLPVLLVGMDTPQLDAGLIETAAKALMRRGTDAVLGLAHDGGFWVIGVRQPVPRLFEGVQMSTSQTGTHQLARLGVLGLECVQLTRLRDVDVWDDAIEVARAAPSSRFAAVLGTCGSQDLSRGATARV